MANMVPNGRTPIVPPPELEKMGYTIALYPVHLLAASVKGIQDALKQLSSQTDPDPQKSVPFPELKDIVGFTEYHAEEAKYSTQ